MIKAIVGFQKAKSLPNISQFQWLAALTILYTFAWGGLLLTANGVFWDDWTLVGGNQGKIRLAFDQAGLPLFGTLHVMMQSLGVPVYKLSSYFLNLLAGFAFFRILSVNPQISVHQAGFAAAIFLTIPVNAARHTMITFPYSLSLGLFFIAWFLLIRSPNPSARIVFLASVMLLLSFSTASFMVFSLLPLIHLLILESRDNRIEILKFARNYWPLIIAPPIYFMFKSAYLQPNGVYKGYNEITYLGIMNASFYMLATTVPLAISYFIYKRSGSKKNFSGLIFFIGAFAWALGAFPYISVGRRGIPFEWGTRDTLLWQFGISLCALAVAIFILKHLGFTAAFLTSVAALVISMLISMSISISYWVDWQKQIRIIELLKLDNNVENASVIMFKDSTLTFNMFESPYRFYAWNGLMNRAYNTSTRLGFNYSQLPEFIDGSFKKYVGVNSLEYGAGDYLQTERAAIVEIKVRNESPSDKSRLQRGYSKLRNYIGMPPLVSEIFNLGNLTIESMEVPTPSH